MIFMEALKMFRLYIWELSLGEETDLTLIKEVLKEMENQVKRNVHEHSPLQSAVLDTVRDFKRLNDDPRTPGAYCLSGEMGLIRINSLNRYFRTF